MAENPNLKRPVDVSLPVDLLPIIEEWAARANMSRDAFIGNVMRMYAVEVAHVMRVYRDSPEIRDKLTEAGWIHPKNR